ncbi:unnamed protein product [Boreogadus saida]
MESSDEETLSERSYVSGRSLRSERSGGSLSPCPSGPQGGARPGAPYPGTWPSTRGGRGRARTLCWTRRSGRWCAWQVSFGSSSCSASLPPQ